MSCRSEGVVVFYCKIGKENKKTCEEIEFCLGYSSYHLLTFNFTFFLFLEYCPGKGIFFFKLECSKSI